VSEDEEELLLLLDELLEELDELDDELESLSLPPSGNGSMEGCIGSFLIVILSFGIWPFVTDEDCT
jgi:hypothetical protein